MRLENSAFFAIIWSLGQLYALVRQIITLTKALNIINDFLCVDQKLTLRIDILDHMQL